MAIKNSLYLLNDLILLVFDAFLQLIVNDKLVSLSNFTLAMRTHFPLFIGIKALYLRENFHDPECQITPQNCWKHT